MGRQSKWSAPKRRAHKKRARKQRARRLKRYRPALIALEHYISRYLDEVLVTHTARRTPTSVIFQFENRIASGESFYVNYPGYSICWGYAKYVITTILRALNEILGHRKVRIFFKEETEYEFVFTAKTLSRIEDIKRIGPTTVEAYRLASYIKL